MRFKRTNIVLTVAMLMVSALPAFAQKRTTAVVVAAAESKRALRGAAADNKFAKLFNQRVAPKGTPGVRESRAVNPVDGTILFPIKPNAHLFDSNGRKSGVVAATEVKINYGATRTMKGSDGKRHVYHQAWSTPTKSGELASGWIRRTNLTVKPDMPKVTAKKPPAGPQTTYRITGGNPQSPKVGRTNASGQFVPFKVTPGYVGGGRNASDYLLRPGGVVNQSFNLPGKGGVSHDSYRPGTIFKRTDSIPAIVTPLYYPGGTKAVGHLTFFYGTVQTPSSPRYGWIPQQALRRKP